MPMQFMWCPASSAAKAPRGYVLTKAGHLLEGDLGGQLVPCQPGMNGSCAAVSPDGRCLALGNADSVTVHAVDKSKSFCTTITSEVSNGSAAPVLPVICKVPEQCMLCCYALMSGKATLDISHIISTLIPRPAWCDAASKVSTWCHHGVKFPPSIGAPMWLQANDLMQPDPLLFAAMCTEHPHLCLSLH